LAFLRFAAVSAAMAVRLRALSDPAPPPVCGDCTDGDPPSDEECAVVDDTGSWQPWG
jgi:hypothetical protein